MNRAHALMLLSECTGDDIWSLSHCRLRKVPEPWIRELSDAFESGQLKDFETIFVGERRVNQYEGVRDVDLACKIGELLGVNVGLIASAAFDRQSIVRGIQEAVEEG